MGHTKKHPQELLDIDFAKGSHRLGKPFWDRKSADTGVSVHNLKSLITEEGRQITAHRLGLKRKARAGTGALSFSTGARGREQKGQTSWEALSKKRKTR